MTQPSITPFSALILAADRSRDDPLIRHAGANSKALVEVGGTPMILRVLDALQEATETGPRLLAGPSWATVTRQEKLRSMIESGEIQWVAPRPTPSASASNAMQTIDPELPVLVTTADLPLLNARIVDYFCQRARHSGLDLAIGLTSYDPIRQAFPSIRKTVLHFQDGNYCGCNLFAFLSPRSRRVADYWRQIETQRKKPMRIITVLGWGALLRYLSGRLSLPDALQRISERMHLRIGAIQIPFAEAGVDVDTIADHVLVQQLIRDRERTS